MANVDIQIPIKGFSSAAPNDKQPALTTPYMNNCRPFGKNGKIQLWQRFGLDKWGVGTQVGAAEQPVVCMVVVSSGV